jgi:hypothetical protein
MNWSYDKTGTVLSHPKLGRVEQHRRAHARQSERKFDYMAVPPLRSGFGPKACKSLAEAQDWLSFVHVRGLYQPGGAS